MGGLIGRLFREFAVTLAASIGMSALLSLTLTPMMRLFAAPGEEGARTQRAVPLVGARALGSHRVLRPGPAAVLRHQLLTLVATIATLALTIGMAVYVPKGFFPQQDTGMLLGLSEAAPDVSFAKMMDLQRASPTSSSPIRTCRPSLRSSVRTARTHDEQRPSLDHAQASDQRSAERGRDRRALEAEGRRRRRRRALSAVVQDLQIDSESRDCR